MRDLEDIKQNKRIKKVHSCNESHLICDIYVGGWLGSCVVGFDEDGWEHVSVAPYNQKRTPSWDDMCVIKQVFWKDEEACIQIHPKKSDYVNIKENCLHIWRNKDMKLPS